MRNLTILREKTFVACLAKMKVYVEDPAANELVICGVPCRKLGDLKNGERKTFSVEEDARRIFVIADQVTKDYCCEIYALPAGQEDVSLTGKNCFEPSRGNAFRFAGNTTQQVISNRKHGKKIGVVVLICAFLIGALIGFIPSLLRNAEKEKTFTAEELSITLTDAFREIDSDMFLASWSSKDAAVFVVRDAFADFEELEGYSLDRYARLTITVNELDATLQHTESGIPYFDFVSDDGNGGTYSYRAYVYRSDEAFWVIQFSADQIEKRYARFDAWADTVTFDGRE